MRWCLLLLGVWAASSFAKTLDIPPALKPWQQWVLYEHPEAQCPFISYDKSRECVWPKELIINANQNGATFQLAVEVFAEGFIELPSGKNLWPKEVKTTQGFLPVSTQNLKPFVYLSAGQHTIEGRFSWAQMPLAIEVPQAIGIVRLNLAGNQVSAPNRDASGTLWLREPEITVQKAEANTLTTKVFRRLSDDIPQRLLTFVQLQVSGQEREVTLGPILLPGFVPREFNSQLPARVEPDGQLRVQIKPGRYDISLDAHSPEIQQQFKVSPMGELWPQQEVWAFATNPSLRTVQLDGAPIIDGSQTQMPSHWQELPTYLLTPDVSLNVKEQHRGDPTPASNDLSLSKAFWLDFNGDGLTVKDTINGQMHQHWRLEVNQLYELGRASLNGEPQLITKLHEGGETGVEVRQRQLNLTAVSRVNWQNPQPVSGWQETFNQVNATFHLPPGWAAIHIGGADSVNGAWLSRWNLWDIFIVLVIAVALWRAVSLPTGILALVTLVLIYQRAQAPVFAWLFAAAGFALLPFVKERFAQMVSGYLGLCFALLVVLIIPFAIQEARLAIYPQLENNSRTVAHIDYDMFDDGEIEAESLQRTMLPDMVSSAPLKEAEERVSGFRKTANDYQADYNPEQKIQVGPGLPNWQWQSVSARWSGPVTSSDTTHFWLAPPWLTFVGHVLSIVLLLLLLADLAKRFWQTNPKQHFANFKGAPAAALCLLLATSVSNNKANADVVIDSKLLTTLEQRLLAAPECLPNCASIEAVNVSTADQTLTLKLTVHAQHDVGIPLPGALQGWWPSTVTSMRGPAPLLHVREQQLFALIAKGRHQLELTGALAGINSLNLNFQMPLHNVTSNTPGWALSGLPTNQQTSQTLSLKREQKAKDEEGKKRLTPAPIAPYVMVHRRINLGLEWSVTTQVSRIAPDSGVIHLSVPLLPGEAPTSGELNTSGQMDVRLGANQRQVSWQSNLPIGEAITLTAASLDKWVEVWTVQTSPMWHSQFKGIPQVANRAQTVWPVWQPRSGETVTVNISRPIPTAGHDYAIDNVVLTHKPAKRASDSQLQLKLRATYGSQMVLPLPPEASLKRVLINGRETPMSHTDNLLKIPIAPGEQNIDLQWQTPLSVGLKTQTPPLALGGAATNINLELNLPRDRWVLLVGGPALGPAILFWGVLVVVLVVAVALGKSGLTPLKIYEWVLLSLGVATINFWVLGFAAAWFLALSFRGRFNSPPNKPAFNAVQILLCIFSVIALLALVSSVPSSLLSNPEMYITGNYSSAFSLKWYQDHSADLLPQGWAISLPMMAYRIIMLLWSLWLAFALMRWIKWGWAQLNAGGFWFVPAKITPTKPAQKSDQHNADSEQK